MTELKEDKEILNVSVNDIQFTAVHHFHWEELASFLDEHIGRSNIECTEQNLTPESCVSSDIVSKIYINKSDRSIIFFIRQPQDKKSEVPFLDNKLYAKLLKYRSKKYIK